MSTEVSDGPSESVLRALFAARMIWPLLQAGVYSPERCSNAAARLWSRPATCKAVLIKMDKRHPLCVFWLCISC